MSSATKAPGAEGPGAYGIPGLPDRLSQSDQLRIFSAYYADRLPAEAAAELCELADEWDEQIASAPAPSDPAGAGGDLGELERLSKAATQGEWRSAKRIVDGCRRVAAAGVNPSEGRDENVPWVGLASFIVEVEGRDTPAGHANTDFAVASVNYVRELLARSGQLVASTPGQKGAGEEKTGASFGPGSREPGPLVPAFGFDPSRVERAAQAAWEHQGDKIDPASPEANETWATTNESARNLWRSIAEVMLTAADGDHHGR